MATIGVSPQAATSFAQTSLGNATLPAPALSGWPLSVDSTIAWDGADLREDQYVYTLNESEIQEIEAAMATFKASGLHYRELCPTNFPVPTLEGALRALAQDIHCGRGFFSLRGLDPSRFSDADNAIIFLGVSSYIGNLRAKQDDMGRIFAHIRDAKEMNASQKERPLRDSSRASTFHTELFGDILALHVRNRAPKGGAHMLTSINKVYMELLKTQPELIPILTSSSWSFDTRSSLVLSGKRPILYHHEGRILTNFFRDPLIGVDWLPRPEHLPRATPRQIDALNAVETLANRHQCVLNLQRGDMIFVNNMSVLHARGAFEDVVGQPPRYLVRLLLKNSELAWSLPPELHLGNARMFGACPGIEESWNPIYQSRVDFHESEIMPP